MRLDHVSYVASHDQISDVVNRIGSQIGTAFVDGGIHPKFGTRNFTAPLLNGQYIEIVCPLDHPATDATPFGQAVKKKAEEGGGWMAWVLATEEIVKIEEKLGRQSIDGIRLKPDGSTLKWKQLGVTNMIEDSSIPFYVEWNSRFHPSGDGVAKAELIEIGMFNKSEKYQNFHNLVGFPELQIQFSSESMNLFGIKDVTFKYNEKKIVLD